MPGTAGGSNWGSVAFDPERGLLFANTSRIANTIQIVRREEVDVEAEEAVLGLDGGGARDGLHRGDLGERDGRAGRPLDEDALERLAPPAETPLAQAGPR